MDFNIYYTHKSFFYQSKSSFYIWIWKEVVLVWICISLCVDICIMCKILFQVVTEQGPDLSAFICCIEQFIEFWMALNYNVSFILFSLSLSWSFILRRVCHNLMFWQPIKYCLGRGRKSIQLLLHCNDCIWQGGTIKPKPDNYQILFPVVLLL